MHRRGFLQMLGRALAAPLLPKVSVATASRAAYPAGAMRIAMASATSRVNFSVFSLAQQLGLQLGQAEQLMRDMSDKGILGPLQGTTQSGRWARSTIWSRAEADALAARKIAQQKKTQSQTKSRTKKSGPKTDTSDAPDAIENTTAPWADLRPMLAHLYDMCRAQGMTPHPRCIALATG
jgi:hypothetical protein